MTQPDLSIQPYCASTDSDALVDIWHQASRIAHAFLGEERLAAQRQQIAEIWLPAAKTYVARIDDEPAGFISLLDHVVGGLFVAPQHQGRGIGQALLMRALEDHQRLELDVYLDNGSARRFYRDFGFIQESTSPVDGEGLPFGIAHLVMNQG